jgi:predicted metalloprotease with PDZ domain
MASVEDASNRLQFLAPHFAPVGYRPATTEYTLTNLNLNKLGINLSYNESGVNQVPQGLLGLTYISVPYTKESVFSIVYAGIEFIEIRNFTAGSVAPWCAYPVGKDSGTGLICVASREDAERVADALATLAVAYGKNLSTSFSMALAVMTDKEQRKHPGQTGCIVREVDEDGPAAKAGVQEDDIVHTINGLPCSLQSFSTALAEAIAKPQGGLVHTEILRKGSPMSFDLRFPHPEVPAAQLRQQVANSAQQSEPVPSAAPAPAAPPSSVHFGFQVRPVIKDDMAPLMLTRAEGLVVVSVENGGLADTMGVLAGDVILQVNGADVGDINHFVQTIRSGAARSFRVWRKGQTIELSVPQSL